MSILNRIKKSVALTALSLLAVIGLTSKQVRTQRNMSRSKYLPHHSEREAVRRRRQMAAGTLRAGL
jgi:hypothetical protein